MTLAFTDDQWMLQLTSSLPTVRSIELQTVRYTAVFEAAGLPPHQDRHLGRDSDVVTAFMKAFRDRCRGAPLAPARLLIVHSQAARERRPGGGYFKVNGHADPFAERSNASAEAVVAAHTF